VATATATPVLSPHDRRAERKKEKARRRELEKLRSERISLGQEHAANKRRIDELRDAAARAVILRKPTEPFDEERRKIEDRNTHLARRQSQLLGVDQEIARLNGRLRSVLADPALREELHLARSKQHWADRRLAEAQKDMQEAESRRALLRPEGKDRNCDEQDVAKAAAEVELAAAELAEAERLHALALADVGRVKQALLDE
jgi:hypothetical protein